MGNIGKVTQTRSYFPADLGLAWEKKLGCIKGAVCSMEYIEKILEKLKEWTQKLIEALLGPEVQPESEPVPIPVRDPKRHR